MAEAEDAAVDLIEGLRERLSRVERRVQERREAGHRPPRVVGLEWFDPPFATGHWVPEQVRRAGGWELLGREGERSVETTWDAVRDVDPEMLVLMACGFHVREAVEEWARTARARTAGARSTRSGAARSSSSTARRTSAGRVRG